MPNEKPDFEIPDANIKPLAVAVGDSLSADEASAFSARKSETELRRTHWDWRLRICFKVLLFLFVLGINAWWSYEIKAILWRSGSSGSDFHLSDSVLIALVSTSIANFLGLVVIVARHLFPSDSAK